MIDIKHIKTFIFNHAQYKMSDEKGNEIILKIDYKNNSYSLKNISKTVNKSFRTEARMIARDLLRRKHGINFADKLKI
ncbi:MAG: hypothetical protein A2570_03735 [Candidatus Brennerbacteria bacterium RIFOXYD1_FULL_41_16]|uniref:Uncharacterized protein n=1 Tax=Candidatus Brennerbacteria bacterium RIFOXYD1_FULL_41_16 TaxID=1797529 RepID=A0A1G1XK05_9BACT|nr:MAG: hypothetical protein A2570_03735 [Candidatus Brennerbacteria bacterium RIFOXYD1_FULL_41_16]